MLREVGLQVGYGGAVTVQMGEQEPAVAKLGRLAGKDPAQLLDTGWRLLFISYGLVSLTAALFALRRLPETNPALATDQTKRRPIRWSRPWVLLLLVTVVTGASWAMVSPILMVFLQEKLVVVL